MFNSFDEISNLSKSDLEYLIKKEQSSPSVELQKYADSIRRQYYGDKVFFRGLVEFSNYCIKNCYYCGLNRENSLVKRYRLSKEDILKCCQIAHEMGFNSFVLQSGEDMHYNNGRIVEVVSAVKNAYPDCSITVSIGELPKSMYKEIYDAGAERYLLRHETSNKEHYNYIHSFEMSIESRKKCLYSLKETGFAVGAGFMVGSPGQKISHLAEDLIFLRELQPEMVGIGPFIPHSQTIFSNEPAGSLSLSLIMIALVRILLPKSMLPSTTALGTIDETGRSMGLSWGANVVMPNITPAMYKSSYNPYDGKAGTDDGLGEGLEKIKKDVINAGYTPDFSRGDHFDYSCNSSLKS